MVRELTWLKLHALGCVIVVATGCRLGLDWGRNRQARTDGPAHVLFYSPNAMEVGTELAVLEASSEVGRAEIFSTQTVPAFCEAATNVAFGVEPPECNPLPKHPTREVCNYAVREGFDYIVGLDDQVETPFLCRELGGFSGGTLKNPGSRGCEIGFYLPARARQDAWVIDARACLSAHKTRTFSAVVGEKTSSSPAQGEENERNRNAAHNWLIDNTEAALREVRIPASRRVTLGAGGDATVSAAIASPTGLFRVHRKDRFLGLARSDNAGRLEPISCCFDLAAGDSLVENEPYWILDLLPGISAARFPDDTTLGVSLAARMRRVAGGIVFGVLFDRQWGLGDGGLGTFTPQLGYSLKLVPSVDVFALAGMPIALPDDNYALGPSGAAGLSWTPRAWLFVQAEAGYQQLFPSDLNLRGPTLRLSVGVDM